MGDEADYLRDIDEYSAMRDARDRERMEKERKKMADNSMALAAQADAPIIQRNVRAEISAAKEQIAAMELCFQELLTDKIDFTRIPGTDKPTLLKPGAEILCKIFHLVTGEPEFIGQTEDWEHGIFSYTIRMPLIDALTGEVKAYGIGEANSREKKYRYRRAAKGSTEQIEDPDPADKINTLIKMASKRALVDAVLKATAASRVFTQDLEDFEVLTGQFESASTKQIDFIRKLVGRMDETEAMHMISGMVGYEVAKYADIRRKDASSLIDKLQHTAPKSGAHASAPAQRQGAYEMQQPARQAPAAAPQEPAEQPHGQPDISWDELMQGSQSQAQPAGQVSMSTASKAASEYVCADCGAAITAAENGYSSKKFGRPLCRKCQQAARG
jgi:hypothetical protein